MSLSSVSWRGIDFTPTGDLLISTYSGGVNSIYLYDSDLDMDTIFTTAAVPEASSLITFLLACTAVLFIKKL